MEIINKYFKSLSAEQQAQFAMLDGLYREWNDKINVISRKDIDNLYEHHVLHSLSIGKHISFTDGTQILDVGTGGGFPGIPLAILFPNCKFHLVDSIGKKVRVATEVAAMIGLKNVRCTHQNVKDVHERYDFVVSRAVMPAPELIRLVQKNILRKGRNAMPNGLLCLKGGDMTEELESLKRWHELTPVSDYFDEPYFETKKILFVPL
ncbi:MAG: 16S rRNA (guanine(527)-N(7))-methyltransferase RsmG [Prevotellaceae bacterium]|nr:16S rRNA (guanine(527)-N(7))-methyltransferase RsmG [Prevotellaceae bacterium]